MAQQTINVGTVDNDGTGDTLRAAFTKANANLTELYARITRGNAVPSYLGQIATNCIHPIAVVPGSATIAQSRSIHLARDTMSSWQLSYSGTYGTTETNPGNVTYSKVALEYPVGVITPITWSASRSVTTSGGADTPLCDPIAVSIPRGAIFYIRVLANCAGGVPMVTFNSAAPQIMSSEFSTTSLTDKVDSGAVIGSLGTAGYVVMPVEIVAQTTRPSYFEIGDSIGYGQSIGTGTDQFMGEGILTGALSPYFAFQKAAVSGDFLATFLAGSNSVRRRARANAHCSVIICELGNNDIFGGTTGAANTLITNVSAFAALFPGKPVLVTTVTPRVTTTDAYLTVANMTTHAQEPERLIYNRRVRQNSIPGVIGHIDITKWLESGPDSGKFRAAVDGLAVVADGTHPTAIGYYGSNRSGAVDPAIVLQAAQG